MSVIKCNKMNNKSKCIYLLQTLTQIGMSVFFPIYYLVKMSSVFLVTMCDVCQGTEMRERMQIHQYILKIVYQRGKLNKELNK